MLIKLKKKERKSEERRTKRKSKVMSDRPSWSSYGLNFDCIKWRVYGV